MLRAYNGSDGSVYAGRKRQIATVLCPHPRNLLVWATIRIEFIHYISYSFSWFRC